MFDSLSNTQDQLSLLNAGATSTTAPFSPEDPLQSNTDNLCCSLTSSSDILQSLVAQSAEEFSPLLIQGLDLAKQKLHNAAQGENFDELLGISFGENYNQQIAGELRQRFINGEIDSLFKLEIISSNILSNADGAFAKSNDTIYLSDRLLASHNVNEITGVFLEEFGHRIDTLLNKVDAAGDEGNIFSRLVQGENISGVDLFSLKQEDDSATIFVNGQAIAIEQALPTLTLSVTDGTAAETNTGQVANPGTFRFTRTGSTATALTVYYSITGTATKGTDYNNLTGTVVIPIGATFANVVIRPINDTSYEGTEKATLNLQANAAYSLGTTKTATVNILDNDKPTITVVAKDSNAGEVATGLTQNPGQFTLTRSGNTASALTAYYTIAGTATNGIDYNTLTGFVTFAAGSAIANININPINDGRLEATETVILKLSSNSAYNLGTTVTGSLNILNFDAAGNSWNKAFSTNYLTDLADAGDYKYYDSVGGGDSSDWYRFRLDDSRLLHASLTAMTGNVDIRIYEDRNENGTIKYPAASGRGILFKKT